MLEYFTPGDNDHEDNENHKQIRYITARLPNTPEDRYFSREEIRNIIGGMNEKKAS